MPTSVLAARIPTPLYDALRDASQLNQRSLAAEARAAIAAHVEAVAAATNDDCRGRNPGSVTNPPGREAERAPA